MSDQQMPDFGELLRQAQEMQAQLAEAQDELADREVTGVAGGGTVKITATGAYEFRKVEIDPIVFRDGDETMLEDLVLAALHDVVERIQDLNAEALGGLGGLTGLLG